MELVPDIISFEHCSKQIFTLVVPRKCPLCNTALETCSSFLPFSIPAPFVNAAQTPCSVVLRPSVGTFLDDYKNEDNLHIAVTDSEGSIVEFDTPGLIRTKACNANRKVWSQCLHIVDVPEGWYDEWDRVLDAVIEKRDWSRELYDDTLFNCFSFVIEFLQHLRYDEFASYVCDRDTFSEKIIVPKTCIIAKYITVYRRVKENGFWAN
ncbi:MKRN2 opposite strand protein isoform X2 [Uranotaenia lowii]|nr:MKRN2 opposite strand protein isoform X2 [Uranotaenia lowii]